MPNPDSTDSRSPGIGGTAAVEPVHIRSLLPIYSLPPAFTAKPSASRRRISPASFTTSIQRCAYTSDKHFYDLVLAFNYKFMIDGGSVKLNAVFAAML